MAAQYHFKTIRNLWVLMLAVVMVGCMDSQRERILKSIGYEAVKRDTVNFPLLINDSAGIVYQFGHMTADKGLKLYKDTMAYSPARFHLDDSIREKLTYP